MKKIIVLILIILILVPITITSYANKINTDDYKNIYVNDNSEKSIRDIGGKVLGIVQVVALAVAIITLTILGARYMVSSAQDKAEIKSKMIPFVIGALLLFGGTSILTIIVNFVNKL